MAESIAERCFFSMLRELSVVGNTPLAGKWWNTLVGIYEYEQHREFSNLDWVVEMLFRTEEIGYYEDLVEHPELDIAVWFLRAVYFPDREDFSNRISSAQLAGEFMENLNIGDTAFRQKVIHLVASPEIAKEKHFKEYAILNDAIWEWTSYNGPTYKEILQRIREEARDLSILEFIEWRENQLRPLIDRNSVFLTTGMTAQYESAAWAHINAELNQYHHHVINA